MTRFLSYVLFISTLSLTCALEAHSEIRKLNFAKEYQTGKLTVYSNVPTNIQPKVKTATAIGNISIDVPPTFNVMLDVNPQCIQHPERLANLPTSGIDEIRITYMSMEDDVNQVDKALAAMPAFKHLTGLVCSRTDLSDAGLLKFKSLDSLEHLDCFMSALDGSFLKEIKRLQKLKILCLSNNGLKPENVRMLAQLPNLEFVDLALADLHDDGLLAIAKSKNLQTLFISSDPKITDAGIQSLQNCPKLERINLAFDKNITDKSIPTLQKLSKLSYLNLDSTAISATALAKLKDLKLAALVMPQRYLRADMTKLRSEFRPNILQVGNRSITKDIEVELAPLK